MSEGCEDTLQRYSNQLILTWTEADISHNLSSSVDSRHVRSHVSGIIHIHVTILTPCGQVLHARTQVHPHLVATTDH